MPTITFRLSRLEQEESNKMCNNGLPLVLWDKGHMKKKFKMKSHNVTKNKQQCNGKYF